MASLMIMGTMSSAGKSYIVTGLCRYFARLGYKVAPFKSQNMALNSYVTDEGLEIGRAQAVQAFAANTQPNVNMNPILLKPTDDVGSQVIVMGKSIGNMRAREYFEYKKSLIPVIKTAYDKLCEDNDIVIIEGAGSPAEINLKHEDIVNMGLAKMLNVPVLLAGDIDPGGVFAQLYGTMELLENEEKNLVKGLIINKFRGDKSLLDSGISFLEKKCNKKVVGLLPFIDAKIEAEDSQNLYSAKNYVNQSADGKKVNIAVVRLPRISNFTDFDSLMSLNYVNLVYANNPKDLLNCDLIIIPGTKNTIADLRWLKATGFFDVIKGLSREVPIIGICGGYQMLGERIEDPEQIEGGESETGFGFIKMVTRLNKDKTLRKSEGIVSGATGRLSFLNGKSYKGYEIHNGESYFTEDASLGLPICKEIELAGVYGSYVHGIFDYLDLYDGGSNDYDKKRNEEFEKIADSISDNLDMEYIKEIMGLYK